MKRALAYAIFIAFIVAIVIYGTREHRINGLAMPMLVQAQAQPVVVPWTLTTRCTVNSSNLPIRDPERNA